MHPHKLEFRDFSLADADVLRALHNQFLAADELLKDWWQRVSSGSTGRSKQVFQTARLEGRIVGFLRLVETNTNLLNLSLAVQSELSGQGISSSSSFETCETQ